MRRLLLTITVLAVALTASDARASTPAAFDDDYDAAIAVAGDTQWLVVSGVDGTGAHATYGIKVFKRIGEGAWESLPPLPGKHFNSSVSVQIVLQGATDPAPCVLAPIDAGPQLYCLQGGAWINVIGSQFRKFNIQDVIAPTADSLALIYSKIIERKDRVLTYVTRSVAGGPWQKIGRPFEGIIVAQFEHSDVPGPLRVGIELMDRQHGQRYVAEEAATGWAVVTPRDRTPPGPFVGGPVNVAGSTYFPFTDATTPDTFDFGVLGLVASTAGWSPVGGGALSGPKTAGQGGVGIVDGQPWAIWQEDKPGRRSFERSIRIVNLTGPQIIPTELWAGKRIGPGPLELADAPGPGAYAMYTTGTGKTLRVVVDTVIP